MDRKILFEKEVLDYLSLPSIPKKLWDGVSSFSRGVAILCHRGGYDGYGVCSFDADHERKPRIVKVFGQDPFRVIDSIFVVPSYMSSIDDVVDMDLDDSSKEKAELLLKEAYELEHEGVDDDVLGLPKHEYYFDNIKNDDEARAFIKSWNQRNRIKGRIPKSHEGLVMRLSVIYSEMEKHNINNKKVK